MFAPLVVPLKITVVLFAIFWCFGAVILRTPKRVAWFSVAAALLFVPSCIGVMAIVDTYRYGRFDYANASKIPRDGYIRIPAEATDITLYRNGAGHWAKFNIDTASLRTWIKECRALNPDLNRDRFEEWSTDEPQFTPPELLAQHERMFAERFPKTGWNYDPSMRKTYVALSARGGGFQIWHVPSTGDTYLSAGYW